MKVKQRLETVQANIADIDEAIKSGTMNDAMNIIRDTSRQLNAAANIAEGDSEVNKATVKTSNRGDQVDEVIRRLDIDRDYFISAKYFADIVLDPERDDMLNYMYDKIKGRR